MHVNIPNHWHAKPPFLMDEGLLSISPACCGQLVKILITLELYGICLFILILSTHGMQNGEEGLPSIILAGQGHLNGFRWRADDGLA